MDRIRICYFIGSLKYGGAQKHLSDLINNLDRSDFEPFLVLANSHGHFLQGLKLDQDHILDLKLKRFYDWTGLCGLLKILKFITRNKIQIFQSYLFECNVYGALTKIFVPKLRYIMSIRNMNIKHKFERVVAIRIASWLSNYVTVVSRRVGEFVITREKINPKKIYTLYNSVDYGEYALSDRRVRNEKKFIDIGCVASLNFRKGHDYLFRALVIILEKNSSVRLHLLGDGKRRGELECLAQQLNIGDKILFRGYIPNVKEYLGDMDIFVLPSLEEGMSNALLEAMAIGLPSVTTDVGGNREVNEDGDTGFVVPPKDAIGLADALNKLILDTNLRNRMGSRAKVRIRNKFSLHNMINEYTTFYLSRVMKGEVA